MTVSDLLGQSCYKSDNINKLVTSCWQLVTSLMALLDLWQGCSNKSDTVMHDRTKMLHSWRHKVVAIFLYHMTVLDLSEQPCNIFLLPYIMIVSDLLEQPCNKSNAIKIVASCSNKCYHKSIVTASNMHIWIIDRNSLTALTYVWAVLWYTSKSSKIL
jgi:hypothetical protein